MNFETRCVHTGVDKVTAFISTRGTHPGDASHELKRANELEQRSTFPMKSTAFILSGSVVARVRAFPHRVLHAGT